MIESAMAVRFSAGFCSSSVLLQHRPVWSLDDASSIQVGSSRNFHSGCFNIARNRLQKFNGDSFPRRNLRKNKTQATAEHLDSASDPIKQNGKPHYHPFEDIIASASENAGDAKLTPAETTRTIVEVNNKATLMLTNLIGDGVHENILWPDLPYITDEHGNVYFQVKNDEDILQTITSDDNYVQVIIGFDTMEMIKEMELSGPSEIDFGIEEIEDEDSDVEDADEEDEDDEEDDEDWVAVLEDENEDGDDEDDSDESLGDWANLETMRSSHPMYFAKKMAEVASDDPVDWMEQPSAGLAIQGLLRPVLVEEHSDVQRHVTHNKSPSSDENETGKIIGEKLEDNGIVRGVGHESDSSADNSRNGTSFYKLEMTKIQIITAQGNQIVVEVEEFRKAKPDIIAHAAARIISRLEYGGEKMIQALKSLCWRCKGIQAEEVKLIGIDSLGFDLRVCSGTQIQTLRFAFMTRATSEYSAERQLDDLLFPRIHPTTQKHEHTGHKEC